MAEQSCRLQQHHLQQLGLDSRQPICSCCVHSHKKAALYCAHCDSRDSGCPALSISGTSNCFVAYSCSGMVSCSSGPTASKYVSWQLQQNKRDAQAELFTQSAAPLVKR